MTSSAIVKSRWRHRQVYVSLSQLYANIHFQKRFWESLAVFCEYNCYFSPFIVRQALHFSGIERAIKRFILSIFYIYIQQSWLAANLPERWNNSSLMSAAVKKQKFQNFIIVLALILREPVAVEDSTRGSQIQMFLRKSRILLTKNIQLFENIVSIENWNWFASKYYYHLQSLVLYNCNPVEHVWGRKL